ncbi:MAG: adenylate/guanylate cyclase domain-containing protein [Sphingobacteriales bacterium]|nr:MAG: adenylate/guanylate cyclase domain-containing protein [Sphingobacteriales bacterium]
MEENMAILMADLSGYTALTETHGSASAADLIDKYIRIAETCLVGDCRLHERNGDEIMIVSTSADSLLQTALLLGERAATEENFLQIHGGLHFGKVLKRGESYFGSPINLTARIAASATAETFCCSEEFIKALSDKSKYKMKSKGLQHFKNISAGKEVFEVSIKRKTTFYIDSVCRMLLLNLNEAVQHPFEERYFCSSHCLHLYSNASLQ